MKKYTLPDTLDSWIEKHLRPLGFSLQEPHKLAPWIRKLSDHYQATESVTPWAENGLKAAYLAYFFPLNWIRASKALDEAQKCGFFTNLKHIVDWGCGPGTLSKALLSMEHSNLESLTGIDQADVGAMYSDTPRKGVQLSFAYHLPKQLTPQTGLFISYTLNEMTQQPWNLRQFSHVFVLEPSTHNHFQKILEFREQLITSGFQILAPCPHQLSCPMANQPKEWCHDRTHWEQPLWYKNLEKHLPMRNQTLTQSYLLAVRPEFLTSTNTVMNSSNTIRVVGDPLVEKGKTRWQACKDSDRVFLSFLKRHGRAPEILRGDKVTLSEWDQQGNELRFQGSQILSLD